MADQTIQNPATPAATGPGPAQTIPVFNPDGEFGYLPAHQFDAGAVAQGYRQASPEEASQALAEAKYGGFGNAALTGVEHAADVATFGGSTALETGLGVPAESIKGRSEAHPIAGALGTGVGILGPALLTGGMSAGAEGAAEGGSLLARAAQFTAPQIASRIGKGGRGDHPGGCRRSRPGGSGRRGGWSDGCRLRGRGEPLRSRRCRQRSESLGDPNLTAQTALAHVGLSAALGSRSRRTSGSRNRGRGRGRQPRLWEPSTPPATRRVRFWKTWRRRRARRRVVSSRVGFGSCCAAEKS
jgi:hypothetical protein